MLTGKNFPQNTVYEETQLLRHMIVEVKSSSKWD